MSDPFLALVVAILVVGGVVALVMYARYRERFRTAMLALGLVRLGDQLPASFPAPVGFWQAGFKVMDCYAGTFRGFEVVVFRVRLGVNRDFEYRSVAAVRRTKFAPYGSFVATVDATSIPGWILLVDVNAQWPGAGAMTRQLEALTAE